MLADAAGRKDLLDGRRGFGGIKVEVGPLTTRAAREARSEAEIISVLEPTHPFKADIPVNRFADIASKPVAVPFGEKGPLV